MIALSPRLAALVIVVANWALLGPAILGAATVFRRRRWRFDCVEAALSGIATVALVAASAALYTHARPFVFFETVPLVAHVPDNAFPSDHLAACGLTIGFLWRRSKPAALAAAGFALALGIARVLAGLHWPIDIAGGFAEGLLGSVIGGALALPFATRLCSNDTAPRSVT